MRSIPAILSMNHKSLLMSLLLIVLISGCHSTARPNILFILTDDHRHDAFSFMGHPYLRTPNMDRIAREGAHFQNAFVTTSLCSPSRASILTGLYAHTHHVIDNYSPLEDKLVFFPQELRKAGYQTAFIGKWHMGGDTDEPQRGFNHWVAFKGQGSYWADGHGTTRVVPQTSSDGFNVDGKRVRQRGYITDELTDFAARWIEKQPADQPWFCYLSHKAAHSDFVAADRHKGKYAGKKMTRPPTFDDSPANYADKPMWLKNQRNSRHGVDFAYNLERFDIDEYHQRYCETLLAVDDSVGRLMELLKKRGQLDSTLIVYMGDNGFQFGEHGLIDKRTAYEASMRVPLMMRCPTIIRPGTIFRGMAANIDIAPTLLEAAGVMPPKFMQGRSLLAGLTNPSAPARQALLYEYFWEWNYPQTPTTHALRTDDWKFVRYQGVWDLDELYDLKNDPHEKRNLAYDPSQKSHVQRMRRQLFELLDQTGGSTMPLSPDRGQRFEQRRPRGSPQAPYPPVYFQPGVR